MLASSPGTASSVVPVADACWLRNDELDSFLPPCPGPKETVDAGVARRVGTAVRCANNASGATVRARYLGRRPSQIPDVALRVHVVHGQKRVVPQPRPAGRPAQRLGVSALRGRTTHTTSSGDLHIPFGVTTASPLSRTTVSRKHPRQRVGHQVPP